MSTLGNGSYTRTHDSNVSRAIPRFFIEAVQDEVASQQQGRPIFKEEERLELIFPGNNLHRPVMRVTNHERQEYAQAYEAFKAGHEMAHEGTPIEEWSILTRAMVAELKSLEIHTVEQCAALDDRACQRIGLGGTLLRTKAKAYLDEAEHSALVERVTAENGRLHADIASLRNQVEQLSQLANQTHAALMEARNAPNPLLTMTPAAQDPVARAAAAAPAEPVAESSLGRLGAARRGPGRPRKTAEA